MARRVKSACRDCKKCMGSSIARGARGAVSATAALSTFGLSRAFKKKCRVCDHPLSLHTGEPIT
jgi:hypothetical protein